MNLRPAQRWILDSVRHAASVAAIVGARIELNRSLMGRCPFHEDNTPSLSVNQKGQYFHCFGCGVGGDVFRFVELFDGAPFSEAVAIVAAEAGVAIDSLDLPEREWFRSPPVQSLKARQPDSRSDWPSSEEVAAVWGGAELITASEEALDWFRYRYHDEGEAIAQRAELWDLARVIPRGSSLPRWARFGDTGWGESSYRLAFQLWSDAGQSVSLRVRSLDPRTSPKSLAPAGCSARGAVLADPLAVQLLAGECPDWWGPGTVVISEGEPDWLAWAGRQSDAHEDGPAYIGIESGSWTPAIASRIPVGADVVIRTHGDVAGRRYAETIIQTLAGRCRLFCIGGERGVAA